eukprot:182877-Chlamydomonas_euryale.AAC.4
MLAVPTEAAFARSRLEHAAGYVQHTPVHPIDGLGGTAAPNVVDEAEGATDSQSTQPVTGKASQRQERFITRNRREGCQEIEGSLTEGAAYQVGCAPWDSVANTASLAWVSLCESRSAAQCRVQTGTSKCRVQAGVSKQGHLAQNRAQTRQHSHWRISRTGVGPRA